MTRISTMTVLFLGAACATTAPPPELVEARSSYARAEQGPAQKYKPDQLHEARVALDRAEKAFKEEGAQEQTRTLAYVAARKAQFADVNGNIDQLIEQKNQANAQIAQQATAGLEKYRKEAEETRRQAEETRKKLAAAEVQVSEEARGTVITLPGSVLFGPGKSGLRPTARAKLNQVADALKERHDQAIAVQGYTDSRGSEETNQVLSQRRAQTVRDYLVAQGIPSDRVSAEGLGESNPIADNSTAEGRANNRRVEIVVNPAQPTPARRSARVPPRP